MRLFLLKKRDKPRFVFALMCYFFLAGAGAGSGFFAGATSGFLLGAAGATLVFAFLSSIIIPPLFMDRVQ
jgi:hypothetical protein